MSDSIQMNDFIRKKPIFRQHDLVQGGNLYFAKFDLILCRNVIIYFKYSLQNKVFKLFHDHLYTNGYLVLGMHETMLGEITSKFEKKGQAYRKK